MVKKYSINYRLEIAYATIFRKLNPIEEIPIHNVLNITSGDNLTKKNMVPGDHIVYGGGGPTGNTHSKYNVDYETIGIGRVGARCGCVFKVKPYSWATDNALIIQSFDKRFSLNFLRHFLSYSDLGQYANNAMQPVISKTRIKDVTIPLIDIKEQNTFSEILDSIEKNKKFTSNDYDLLKLKIKIIDNWEILNEEIEVQTELAINLKQSIIKEAISGKQTATWRNKNPASKLSENLLQIISSEKEELLEKRKLRVNNKNPLDKILNLRYEIPKTWQWHLLSDVCFYQEGPGIRKHQYRESGIKILNVQNITQDKLRLDLTTRHITKDEYSEKYEHFTIEAGDILFASSGGSWGKTCFFEDPGYKVIMNTSTIRLKSFSEKALLNGYLYLFLKSNFFTQQMTPQLMGMQPNFGSTHLNSVSIPIPPIGEQKAIVEKVELLMQKCQTLEQEIKTSESHSQILMQAVLKEAFESKKEEVEV